MNQIRQVSTAAMSTTYFPENAVEVYLASSFFLFFSDIEELDKLEQKGKCHSEDSHFFYIAILLPARFEKDTVHISVKENLIIQYP